MTMKKEGPDVSIVIACYNDAPHLKNNFHQILEVMNSTRYSYEIIFVEDRSLDNSKVVIEEIVKENPGVNISSIFHDRNSGRGRSVTDGFLLSKGRMIGFLDIDLELHARYIPSLLLEIEKGADFAIARRVYDLNWHSIARFFVSKTYSRLSNRILNMGGVDSEAGFKFFNRYTMMDILKSVEDNHWFWDTEVVCRSRFAGKKIVEIPALFIKLPHKKSTVRFSKDVYEYLVKMMDFRKKMGSTKKQ